MSEFQAILASIPGFAGAEVVEQLADGPTNQSLRMEQGGRSFVLRVDKPEAARLGLNREAELKVIEAIANAGLGTLPVHFDADAGIYLRPYRPGRTWTRADLLDEDKLERLAALLRELHALPPAGSAFKPLLAAGRYARQLGSTEAGNLFGQVASAYALIEPGPPALCHNDLVCQNILEDEKLTLIDWEYAGMGDPYFDLAIVVQHHELEEHLPRHFLAAYLQHQPDEKDLERLAKHRLFYAALLNLWNLRVAL